MNVLVSRLRIEEDVQIQSEVLNVFQTGLGQDETQDVIERAVVEVAQHMGVIEQSLMHQDLDRLRQSAGQLAAISDQLGFSVLTTVSGDAIKCANRCDMTALHAVVERLIRVGDASLAVAIDGAFPP